jgi:hypothetical protein
MRPNIKPGLPVPKRVNTLIAKESLMDENLPVPKENREDQITRMAAKLRGRSKPELVREYLRYLRAKAGKLQHNFSDEFIEVSMKAIKRVLKEKYVVDRRQLFALLKIARKKIRPKPFI